MDRELTKYWKNAFKDHIATFNDYGRLKMIDFKNPLGSEYRIRFIFEEDYSKLHISGDLGELIASSYDSMTFERFDDVAKDPEYFLSKVDCSSRPLFRFIEIDARKDIKNYLKDIGKNPMDFLDEIEDCLEYFDGRYGINPIDVDRLETMTEIPTYDSIDFGKRRTNVLDIYLLAFKLAMDQIKKRN